MMAERRDTSTDYLTFSQRYGYEPLPESMSLEELSNDLRRELWNVLREFLLSTRKYFGGGYYFSGEAKRLIEYVLGIVLKKPEDEIDTSYGEVLDLFKRLLFEGRFNVVLDLIEIIANEGQRREGLVHRIHFAQRIKELFERRAAAYRLDMEDYPFQFFPQSSKEQGEATQQAVKTIRDGDMKGAATHLHDAAKRINEGQFAQAIADSIHAVESVARTIDPKASRTLGPALTSLANAGVIEHPALKEAFSTLYGYTNDEQGIRHPLLDKDAPAVGLDEAMFMFGACTSFAAYLTNKHRQSEPKRDETE